MLTALLYTDYEIVWQYITKIVIVSGKSESIEVLLVH